MVFRKSSLTYVLLFILVFLINFNSLVFAQNKKFTGREQFYDIAELTKLIQTAKDAGFSKQELMDRLSIRDENKILNAMEYIQKQKQLEKLNAAELQKIRNKKYLTIQDLIIDLMKLEPKTLALFRKKLLVN
ncbi:MAG: hypothetical protein ACI86H_000188 [bacterium]|jgi:hypothetical protein